MPAGQTYTATFKTPSRESWDAYKNLCERLGTTRTDRLTAAIASDFELHGTNEEKTLWQTHYEQRPRPGRPRKTPTLTPTQQLTEWAKLRDIGLITEAEYQTKKTQLLGL